MTKKPTPKLSVSKTHGGFWRVKALGVNDNELRGPWVEIEISRGLTKETALQQADEWFASMVGR